MSALLIALLLVTELIRLVAFGCVCFWLGKTFTFDLDADDNTEEDDDDHPAMKRHRRLYPDDGDDGRS